MKRRFAPVLLLTLLVAPTLSAQPVGQDLDPEGLELHEIGSGAQWTLYEQLDVANGTTLGDPDNDTFVAFSPPAVDELVDRSILSAAEAQEIRDDLEAEGKDYRQVDDLFVIRLEAAREATEKLSQLSQKEIDLLPKGCFGWDDKTRSFSWELNREGDFDLFDVDTESFDGQVSADLFLDAMISATVNYKVKKFLCRPVKFRFIDASVMGDITVDGSIEASAALDYTEEWSWDRNLFTLHLGRFTVWLGPVPVQFKFKLPVDFGIDTQVRVAGQAGLRADINGSGTFDVVCTTSDCEGPSDFEYDFEVNDPEYELTLDATAKVWARAAVEVEVIDDKVAVASVGATGFVEANLFAYVGNQCGDLDGDGVGDTLEDLLVDVDAGYTVDARLSTFITSDKEWVLLEGRRHLYFRDLWDDPDGNLTDLLITGPRQGEPGQTLRYEMTTRPCYPYADDIELWWTGLTTGAGSLTPGGVPVATSAAPAAGDYTLEVTMVRDAHGRELDATMALPITVGNPGDGGGGGGSELTNGVAEQNLSGSTGSETFYTLEVPEGAKNLTFTTTNGSGDADLYVSYGSQPSRKAYDCGSIHNDNDESCSFDSPQAGTYHVLIYGYSSYSGLTLTPDYEAPPGEGSCGDSGSVEGLSAATGSELRYKFDVEDCATTVTVRLSGGTGDADLYVSSGSQPSRSTFDCGSWHSDNNETCRFTPARVGTYYILIHAYSTFEGVTLEASYK